MYGDLTASHEHGLRVVSWDIEKMSQLLRRLPTLREHINDQFIGTDWHAVSAVKFRRQLQVALQRFGQLNNAYDTTVTENRRDTLNGRHSVNHVWQNCTFWRTGFDAYDWTLCGYFIAFCGTLDNTYLTFANVFSVTSNSFAIAGYSAFVVYSLCFFIV